MSSSSPTVSVIMPAYNAAPFIGQAIESVLHQTYSQVQLIVVDDGSRDDTAAIAERYARADSRVTLMRNSNSGKPSIVRNIGLARATGEYLSFLDSDDYWHPTRVERLLHGMLAHPDWVAAFHDLAIVDGEGREMGPTYLQNAAFLNAAAEFLTPLGHRWHDCGERFFVFMSLSHGAVHTQSVLIDRRKVAPQVLQFDESFVICEDTDLWLRLALLGRYGYLDEALSCYRQHPTSITKNALLFAQQTTRFHQHNFARVQSAMADQERRGYRRKIAACMSEFAYRCYRNGQARQARSLSMQAFAMRHKWSDLLLSAKTLIPHGAQEKLRSLLTK
jgi:glycosyltransferase involved in cell wall biosynthesis